MSASDLLDMLTYKRPHNSETENEFIDKYVAPISDYKDGFGNYMTMIGTEPTILWSCHTDTVHHEAGRQEVKVEHGKIKLAKPKVGTCLGADNGGGVWLLREMIEAGVPGLYVFHRDEERGGTGSNYIARDTPQVLEGIKFAVAFDRKGFSSVITHQGGRCCSDAFAKQFGAKLGPWFKPDDTGLFTDTANYTHLIPECSNISIGYDNGHGPLEVLDLAFIKRLRELVLAADFSDLVATRDPDEVDEDDWYAKYKLPRLGKSYSYSLLDFVYDEPEKVADFLEMNGFDIKAIEDYYSR